MQVSFVAHSEDAVACLSLKELSKKGHQTRVISNGQVLSPATIGLFGTEKEVRNRYLRLSKHRMAQEEIEIPAWAAKLPFVVAISAPNSRANILGLRAALDHMAEVYGKWGPWMRRPEAPWNPIWKDGRKHDDFDGWRSDAEVAVKSVPCVERLTHRLRPIFPPSHGRDISKLIVTGCALFNQPHTDVVSVIPREKSECVIRALAEVIHDTGVEDVRFVVPRGDLLRDELRDHFHPFMFMSIEDAVKCSGKKISEFSRIRGRAHANARNDEQVSEALDLSADALLRQIVQPLRESTGVAVTEIPWNGYIGPYIEQAQALAEKHRASAEAIYLERVKTRPSYASLHAIDPARGLKRTISNSVFYIAEAMFLKDNPDTAVVNCEFAPTFWKGLEPVLAREIWGDFRPFIGMVPEEARQPWGY